MGRRRGGEEESGAAKRGASTVSGKRREGVEGDYGNESVVEVGKG